MRRSCQFRAEGPSVNELESFERERTTAHVESIAIAIAIASTKAAMPRTLTRLRFKAPVVVNASEFALKRGRVGGHVLRQSIPRQTKLAITVNAKAHRQPTGKRVNAPERPFTLRDVVDPRGHAQHGQIIYIFRNIKTNQIIYSLSELLQDHHLEQLPFIGKHSKTPTIRPDEWTPHCVVAFPTAQQGHNAYRKLRELRKLHELAWDKNNPEWHKISVERRMKKIMDQRANTSADLAEVLRLQGEHGDKMEEARTEQQQKVSEFLDKKWSEIEGLTAAMAKKEKETDNIKWLEHQVRSLDFKLGVKHNQNEADQRRLKNAKIIQEIRLNKLKYALRKSDQLRELDIALTEKSQPARELGAETKLNMLREQADDLRNKYPVNTRLGQTEMDELANLDQQIATLEEAFDAKEQIESRSDHISRSVLPPKLKNTLPIPYTLEGISIKWTELTDASYAVGSWPELIEHETLDYNKERNSVQFYTPDGFFNETQREAQDIRESHFDEDGRPFGQSRILGELAKGKKAEATI